MECIIECLIYAYLKSICKTILLHVTKVALIHLQLSERCSALKQNNKLVLSVTGV